jgi:PKD repeat protein
VTLRVTDSGGRSDESNDTVNPEAPPPPNQPPAAEFSSKCNDLDCEFDDASSDSDGRIEARLWEFGDGSTANDRNPKHEYGTGGTYTVRLTVTDNDGASTSAEQAVTVTGPNQPPTAEFTWSCTNLDCQFTDQSADSDGITSWSWRFDDGTESTAQSPAHSFPGAGTYHVRLTVTDTRGGSADVTHDVTVSAPVVNAAPAANDDPATTDPGTPVTINVLTNDSDPEGASLVVTGVSDPANGTALSNGDGTITYTPDPGFAGATDVFTYTVSDGSLSDDATVSVAVSAPPPTP